MPKYIIKQYETVINNYEVEADNIMQALLDFRSNKVGDFIEKEDCEPEVNNEVGIHFNELPEEITETDKDKLRFEFNIYPDDDYLESILSIEEKK